MTEKTSSLEGDDSIVLGAKELAILVPLVASALAVGVEVGYFLKIGGGVFGAFSIAEHINFAVPALPVALVFTIVGLIIVRVAGYENWRGQGARLQYRAAASILFGGLAAELMIKVSSGDLFLAGLVVAGLGAILFLYVFSLKSSGSAPNLLWLSISAFIGLLFLSISVGYDAAQRALSGSRYTARILTDSALVNGRVLRVGERTVLYFDSGSKRIELVASKSVKTISWAEETSCFLSLDFIPYGCKY